MIDYGMRLVKSPFIQIAREGDNAVIWHSLFGNPKIVSDEALEFLDLFVQPTTLLCAIGGYKLSAEEEGMIEELCNDFYLTPSEFDARRFLTERMREREKTIVSGSLINYLSLIVSEACNFRCAYCFHFNRFVKDRLTGMMEMCRGCMIEGQCGGGCNITQEFACSMQTTKIERMCEFYCRMTQELLLEQLREAVSAQ